MNWHLAWATPNLHLWSLSDLEAVILPDYLQVEVLNYQCATIEAELTHLLAVPYPPPPAVGASLLPFLPNQRLNYLATDLRYLDDSRRILAHLLDDNKAGFGVAEFELERNAELAGRSLLPGLQYLLSCLHPNQIIQDVGFSLRVNSNGRQLLRGVTARCCRRLSTHYFFTLFAYLFGQRPDPDWAKLVLFACRRYAFNWPELVVWLTDTPDRFNEAWTDSFAKFANRYHRLDCRLENLQLAPETIPTITQLIAQSWRAYLTTGVPANWLMDRFRHLSQLIASQIRRQRRSKSRRGKAHLLKAARN